MIEALKYYQAGLSVIPCGKDKLPIGKWKERQTKLIKPTGIVDYMAIICGVVSGNLICIDIDCKYDLSGTLFKDYCDTIKQVNDSLLKKIVVEKSPSGGYHFVYRTTVKVGGNKKLANRHTTEAERKINPDEKQLVLIETRGEGGYFVCAPSPNYKLLQGSFENVPIISEEEHNLILDSARIFNEVYNKPIEKKEYVKIISDGKSPFDDWNERGDVLSFLQENGWKITLQRGVKNLLLRPNGTGKWSADWDSEKRIFYVFTSSSQFENNTGYNATQVLNILKFNGDYSSCSKWLRENGYGENKKADFIPKAEITNDCQFLASEEEMDSYVNSIRDGTFKFGKETNIPELDEHFRFKEANLVIVNGHDNTGKSTAIWYLQVLSALFYGWKHGILSAENDIGGIKRKLIEFYLCKHIKSITDEELRKANKWVKEHFFIISNEELYDIQDVLKMITILKEKYNIDYCLVDPYNALARDSENFHEHDYKSMSQVKLLIKKIKCGVYINCHAITNSLRREYAKDHKYAGFPYPPGKADTEGGGKFANKADDFLTFHRLVQHPHEWMNLQIHVRKIKVMETGGRATVLDEPVVLEMLAGGYGFKSASGVNPVYNFWNKIKTPTIQKLDFTQSTKEQSANDDFLDSISQ